MPIKQEERLESAKTQANTKGFLLSSEKVEDLKHLGA